MTAPDRWIQGAHIKKGALHRQLGYDPHHHLPLGLLREIEAADIGARVRGRKITRLMKRRVNFALNVRR
jgi:hypothetical protein